MTRIINKEEAKKQYLEAVDVVCMDCAFLSEEMCETYLFEKLLTS